MSGVLSTAYRCVQPCRATPTRATPTCIEMSRGMTENKTACAQVRVGPTVTESSPQQVPPGTLPGLSDGWTPPRISIFLICVRNAPGDHIPLSLPNTDNPGSRLKWTCQEVGWWRVTAQGGLQHLVGPLCLTIGLGMVTRSENNQGPNAAQNLLHTREENWSPRLETISWGIQWR